jgi:hypothetical protein
VPCIQAGLYENSFSAVTGRVAAVVVASIGARARQVDVEPMATRGARISAAWWDITEASIIIPNRERERERETPRIFHPSIAS